MWHDSRQAYKKTLFNVALQPNSKRSEMIHFMIKNAITTGVILKQLKKKVNKMLYPYIAEFDMKSAKKLGLETLL